MGVKKALSCSSGNRKVCKLFTGSITGNGKLKPPRRLQPLHRYATTTTQGHQQACSGMYAGSMCLMLIDARRSWTR